MLNEFHLQNIDMQRDSNNKSKDVNSAEWNRWLCLKYPFTLKEVRHVARTNTMSRRKRIAFSEQFSKSRQLTWPLCNLKGCLITSV